MYVISDSVSFHQNHNICTNILYPQNQSL